MRAKIIFTAAAVLTIIALPAGGALAESARMTPVVKVVREWAGAVVNISAEQVGVMRLNSVGSGVIISEDGLILTNAHVVKMAGKIYVLLNDMKQTEAVVEAVSEPDELALIRIKPPEKLKAARLANDVVMGETVVAMGNPLGLENSVSVGVVSGLNRKILSNGTPILTGLIQTDASTNEGSSGGALLNLDGELVGINIAIVQGANSIGLAIPYDRINKFLKDYREGRVPAVERRPKAIQVKAPNTVDIKVN